jgi:hypothetical protein
LLDPQIEDLVYREQENRDHEDCHQDYDSRFPQLSQAGPRNSFHFLGRFPHEIHETREHF